MLVWHEFEVRLGQLADELLDHLHLVEVVLAGEDGRAPDQLREDAADGPHVDLLVVVLLAEDDFGRAIPPGHHVFGEGVGELGVAISELFYAPSQPEIANFQVTVSIDEQVAGLNVPMHDVS